MQPPDPRAQGLLEEWVGKAGADLLVAGRTAGEALSSLRVRKIVGFHCQPGCREVSLLTRWQIEFPKTHDIKTLLLLVGSVDAPAAEIMYEARWLTPFGVEIRCPGDAAEMLPGDEAKAIEIAASRRCSC